MAEQDELLELLRAAFEWARSGDVDRLTHLLDLGASPNLTNDKGDTLLILAAYHQQEETVRLLIERGADVERVNDNGQPALAAAVFRRATAIVTALLAAGADPDTGPRSARTVAEFFELPEMLALLPAGPENAGPAEHA